MRGFEIKGGIFMQNAFDGAMESLKSAVASVIKPMGAFLNVFSNFWIGAALIAAVFVILLVINILRRKTNFLKTLKSPYTLAICAMMIAVNIALGYYTLRLSSYLRIGFGFVTQPIVALLFGPAVCCITGISQDIISFVMQPTGAYIFTYTLNVGIGGMIYGMMLHGKRVSFWRVFLTKLIIISVVNIVLNSIVLAPTAGGGMVGILPARIIKNILLLPIQAVVVYILLKATEKLNLRRAAEAGK